LDASQADAPIVMLAVATGDITQDAFAGWLRLHARQKLAE